MVITAGKSWGRISFHAPVLGYEFDSRFIFSECKVEKMRCKRWLMFPWRVTFIGSLGIWSLYCLLVVYPWILCELGHPRWLHHSKYMNNAQIHLGVHQSRSPGSLQFPADSAEYNFSARTTIGQIWIAQMLCVWARCPFKLTNPYKAS